MVGCKKYKQQFHTLIINAEVRDKNIVKGALSGLRQFLTFASPLKVMKNDFYFTLKARFVLKIFKFLSWLFCDVEKWLD